jgi:hypothetical protein
MRRSRDDAPEEKCNVSGCDQPAERSLSRKKVTDAMEWTLTGDEKRALLCKTHYKEYKKETKEERKIESLRR